MSIPNYWDYLKLDRLLDLQGGLEEDETKVSSDELHFILVHQAFELWFKLVLVELRLARDHLAVPRVPERHIPLVVHHLRRINMILQLCTQQFAVMETLTPQDFLAFRDKLVPASGFQSFQLREIEILMGLLASQREATVGFDPLEALRKLGKSSVAGPAVIARLEQARDEDSLLDVLRSWLLRTPIQGSAPSALDDDSAVQGFVDEYLAALEARLRGQSAQRVAAGVVTAEAASERLEEGLRQGRAFLQADDESVEDRARTRRIRAAILFIESYRELPLLAWPRLLLDSIVEFEEQMVLFRTRHARMVERVIGRRVGTGGSSGVDYLDRTTKYRIFTELWTIRTLLMPRAALPELRRPDVYEFADSLPGSTPLR